MVLTAVIQSSTILCCPARAHTTERSHGKTTGKVTQSFSQKSHTLSQVACFYTFMKDYAELSKSFIWPTAAMNIGGLKQLNPRPCISYNSSSTWRVGWRIVVAFQWKVFLLWPR